MNTFKNNILFIKRLLLCSSIVFGNRCLHQPILTLKMFAATSAVNNMVLGYITISNSDSAKDLSKKLVENKLVACVNIIPKILSIYEWKNKIEEDEESLMIIKTHSNKQDAIIKFVKNVHPYEVPEVIFTTIVDGNPDYINWMNESLDTKGKNSEFK